ALDAAEVRNAIRTLTRKARLGGAEVRWHPDPAVSAVISRKAGHEWARWEFLLSHVESSERPNLKIYRAQQPEAFAAIEQMFDGLWSRALEPPVDLPAVESPQPELRLVIHSARFGLQDKWTDVTAEVRAMVRNGQIDVPQLTHRILGCEGPRDPWP